MGRFLGPFKDAGLIYYEEIFKIIFIGIVFVLPIQLFVFIGSTMGTIFALPIISNSLDLFLLTLGLSIAQIPYISMVFRRLQGEELTYVDLFQSLKENITPVYITGLVVALIVSLGFILIIPGILCFIFCILFPQVAVMEKEHYWQGIKKTFQRAKSNFLTLMNVLLFFAMIDWWLLWGAFTLISNYEFSFMMMAAVHSFVQLLVLPYFSFVLSEFYIKWSNIDSVDSLY